MTATGLIGFILLEKPLPLLGADQDAKIRRSGRVAWARRDFSNSKFKISKVACPRSTLNTVNII